MYLYYRALTIKWFTLGFLSSLSVSFFFVFFMLSGWPEIEQWCLGILLTSFGMILFYEWYKLPQNTYLGGVFYKIFEHSYQRTIHLSHAQAEFDAFALMGSLTLIFGFGFLSWLFPEYSYWFRWVIIIVSGFMGTYVYNEEFKTPKENMQRKSYFSSLGIFLFIIMFVFVSSKYGIEYSVDRHEFPIFIVTVSAWFSFGILGSTLRALFQSWRDNVTAPKTQNQVDG